MRIAGYVRVSTDFQVREGYSLEAQKDRLISYCKSQEGWEIVSIYIEEGESAKDMKRPELQRLLSDAEKGLFDVVLVYRLDRITRSVVDLYQLLETFDKYDVKFKSVSEIYDTTTPTGRLFITLVAALAEFERSNLGERVRFGMEQLVRDGKWQGGPVPFGYRWEGQAMHLVLEEVVILKELRRLYMADNGFGATAKALNFMGYTRRGFTWSAQSVWYVLDNPVYAGKTRYGTKKKNGKYANRKKEEIVDVIWAENTFPPVYTWEEYEEHTARMKNRQFYGFSRKREYWFSGVIRCNRCGSTMIGRPYRNKRVDGSIPEGIVNYICSGRSMQKGCDMPLLRQSVASDMIMDYIRKITPVNIDELAAAAEEMGHEIIDHEQELDQLRKELRAIHERRKKWQYMFAEDLMNESDFRTRKREEDEKESFLLAHIDELKADEVGVSSGFAQMLYDLPAIFDSLDDIVKKELMQTIFESIVFDCDVKSGRGTAGKGRALPFRIIEVNYN